MVTRGGREEGTNGETGIDIHKLLYMYPTLCNPMNGSPPGSSAHGDSPGKPIQYCKVKIIIIIKEDNTIKKKKKKNT